MWTHFAGFRICCASAVSWRHWVLREKCGVNSGCVLLFFCIDLQHCHYKYRAWQKDKRCITWLRRRGPDLSIVDNHVPTKLGDWEAFHNKTWQFQGHVWLHFYFKTGGDDVFWLISYFGVSPHPLVEIKLYYIVFMIFWCILFNIQSLYLRRGCHCLRIFHPQRGRPSKGPKKEIEMKSNISELCNGATCICTFQTGCKEGRLKCKLGNHGNNLTLIYGISPNNSKAPTFSGNLTEVFANFTVVKVDGATPKRWLSRGPW